MDGIAFFRMAPEVGPWANAGRAAVAPRPVIDRTNARRVRYFMASPWHFYRQLPVGLVWGAADRAPCPSRRRVPCRLLVAPSGQPPNSALLKLARDPASLSTAGTRVWQECTLALKRLSNRERSNRLNVCCNVDDHGAFGAQGPVPSGREVGRLLDPDAHRAKVVGDVG